MRGGLGGGGEPWRVLERSLLIMHPERVGATSQDGKLEHLYTEVLSRQSTEEGRVTLLGVAHHLHSGLRSAERRSHSTNPQQDIWSAMIALPFATSVCASKRNP